MPASGDQICEVVAANELQLPQPPPQKSCNHRNGVGEGAPVALTDGSFMKAFGIAGMISLGAGAIGADADVEARGPLGRHRAST